VLIKGINFPFVVNAFVKFLPSAVVIAELAFPAEIPEAMLFARAA
jgi:hypothetical protein